MSEEINNGSIQVLTFELSQEVFGVDISSVREVLDETTFTKVPQMPKYMIGAINLRGSVVPVIDMNMKFYSRATQMTVNTCIIILEVKMNEELVVLGALVDSVKEVVSFDDSHLEPAPRIGTQLNTDFIRCMAKTDTQFAIILNVNKVFEADDIITAKETEAETAEVE